MESLEAEVDEVITILAHSRSAGDEIAFLNEPADALDVSSLEA